MERERERRKKKPCQRRFAEGGRERAACLPGQSSCRRVERDFFPTRQPSPLRHSARTGPELREGGREEMWQYTSVFLSFTTGSYFSSQGPAQIVLLFSAQVTYSSSSSSSTEAVLFLCLSSSIASSLRARARHLAGQGIDRSHPGCSSVLFRSLRLSTSFLCFLPSFPSRSVE